MRTVVLAAFLLILPSCVAAIGNTGFGSHAYSKDAAPMLRERVAAATRIVELRQQQLAAAREQLQAGRNAEAVVASEILLEEAKLQLIACRLDLAAAEARDDD